MDSETDCYRVMTTGLLNEPRYTSSPFGAPAILCRHNQAFRDASHLYRVRLRLAAGGRQIQWASNGKVDTS